MRKFLFASVIALASAAAIATPADATNLFLGGSYFDYGPFGDFYDSYSSYPTYGPYWGGPYYDHGPGYSYDSGAPYPHRYDAVRHCRTATVRHRSHHHWVRQEVRACG